MDKICTNAAMKYREELLNNVVERTMGLDQSEAAFIEIGPSAIRPSLQSRSLQ